MGVNQNFALRQRQTIEAIVNVSQREKHEKGENNTDAKIG